MHTSYEKNGSFINIRLNNIHSVENKGICYFYKTGKVII